MSVLAVASGVCVGAGFGQVPREAPADRPDDLVLRQWADSLGAVTGQGTSLSVSVESGGSNVVAAAPGATVAYEVVGILSDDFNEGLALVGFDLDFDAAVLEQADTPTGDPDSGCENPMIHFTIPWGITNPAGYGGTIINGDLIQVGGAQNTILNTPDNADFPIGTVLTGVAQPGGCGPAVLVTGSLTAPLVLGTYTLALENLFANVIREGETGEIFWATQSALVGTVANLTIQVGADCNENGVPDDQDLADCDGSPACSDCNTNGILDECDLRTGVRDADANGVPDLCETGACCDRRGGGCVDDVPRVKCPRLRARFAVNTACAGLNPPCTPRGDTTDR